MNVYVREMSSALARRGHFVDVFTRRDRAGLPATRLVEPGFVVHHLDAGPRRSLGREEMPLYVEEFAEAVGHDFALHGAPDAIHANYWLSAQAGHRLKHEWNVPLLTTFHTLERVKAAQFEPESEARAAVEEQIFHCSDAVLASCEVEARQFVEYYDADPSRIVVVPLGVEHAFFSPGERHAARDAVQWAGDSLGLLYVGRLQALKGADLALETAIELRRRGLDVSLAIVGGPSGPEGESTLAELRRRVSETGMIDRVQFVAPQNHQLLSTWMRAADVTLVPSRSESFGLVALESAACGTPVVASAVGGLLTLIKDGVNGALVDSREPRAWADSVERVVRANDDSSRSNAAVLSARRYTWRASAELFTDVMDRVSARALTRC
jgi:D-inositol-3-phosphate glycosyltransferase